MKKRNTIDFKVGQTYPIPKFPKSRIEDVEQEVSAGLDIYQTHHKAEPTDYLQILDVYIARPWVEVKYYHANGGPYTSWVIPQFLFDYLEGTYINEESGNRTCYTRSQS